MVPLRMAAGAYPVAMTDTLHAGAYPVAMTDTLHVLPRGACAYRKADVHPRVSKGVLFQDIR